MDLLAYGFPDDLQDEHGNNYWSGKKLKPKITGFLREHGKDFTKELFKILNNDFDLEDWSDECFDAFKSEKNSMIVKKFLLMKRKIKLMRGVICVLMIVLLKLKK